MLSSLSRLPRVRPLVWCVAVAIALLVPHVADAQGFSVKSRRITCGTSTGPRVQCLTGTSATSVRLVRDLSSPKQCRQSSNWGFDDTSIWVDRGCQGEFEVIPAASPRPPLPGSGQSTRRITCGSNSGAQVECNTEGEATKVVLVRDLSGRSQCRQGFNWGFTDSLIWTNRGCRGEFEVGYQAAPSGGNARRITCGSTTGARVRCNAFGQVSNVVMVRDLTGRGLCRQNSSWGFGRSDIWANGGCRAEFEVTYLAASGGGNTRRITCGSATGAPVECQTNGEATNVVLVRDLSGRNLCRAGTNWGFTDALIWANNGCRAEFDVTYNGKFQGR